MLTSTKTNIRSLGSMIASTLSAVVYNLLYNMDTFHVDASSLRTVDNADVSGVDFDMPMFGSKHIYLPATASVPYPIIYTLGAEIFSNSGFDTDTVWIKSAGVTIGGGVATFTNISINEGLYQTPAFTAGDTYVATYTITITSGSLTAWMGGIVGTLRTTSGTYTEKFVALGGNALVGMFSRSASTNATLDNFILKKLTNPNSYFSHFDVSTKSILTRDNSAFAPSQTYSMVSPNHHSGAFNTNVPLIAADITYLNSNPEAIAQLHTGTLIPELSFVNANVINWYPANEGILGGATITDIKTATTVSIVNYVADCRTNALVSNVNYGISDFLVTKNPTTGVFTGMATAGTITGANDGRYLHVPKTTPVDKTILKDVNTMSGDTSSVTITYVDLTTEVI